MVLDVIGGRLRAGLRKPCGAAHDPTVDDRQRDFRMELHPKSGWPVTEGLVLENFALGQMNGIARKREFLPVPMIDVAWPRAKRMPLLARLDGLITGFETAQAMLANLAA